VRILVTGSRDWTDADAIESGLWAVWVDAGSPLLTESMTVAHGACPTGADAIADAIALRVGMQVERHPADWERYGKRAGFIRNAEMVALGADICLAFIKDHSRGATMTADLAEKAGILTRRWTA
jgi:hypothetical protein